MAAINLFLCLLGVFFGWFVVRSVGILADGSLIYAPPMYANEEERLQIAEKAADQSDIAAVAGTTKVGNEVKVAEQVLQA